MTPLGTGQLCPASGPPARGPASTWAEMLPGVWAQRVSVSHNPRYLEKCLNTAILFPEENH